MNQSNMNLTRNLVEQLSFIFEKNQDREKAIPMEKYLKNHFTFLGIKTPERRMLMKQFYVESGLLKLDFQQSFVEGLWEKEEREYQYAALDYINKSLKILTKDNLTLLQKLITTKSWWDTVDSLAPNAVGQLAKDYPVVKDEVIEYWAYGNHLWLRRAAILYQLKFKGMTEEIRLYRYIVQNATSKEFFIQKAIGWALREYSKTNPISVRQFIQEHPLPKLSVREGSKYI
ncbi:DNA alkylation repair protein [Niallia sp.]|uniref:DNA alkylation repair protein n=1 Tax=Niallia sp. TaxID=2837523 RepID=UPI00289F6A3F|nr:DNA alkylation repair protein [Niallia sp.]